jgi:SAM-dependent methyltransferase
VRSDDENLVLSDSIAAVDELNAEFYGRFPYPWAPVRFERLADPSLEPTALNQTLGDWDHRTVPEAPEVWVAGCGTNQAVYTALRFPRGRVVGTDLSEESLAICADTAAQLGLDNLELRRESINAAAERDRFDLVVCTGVIHHNADPAVPLARLAAAMKPAGVLELMVYNRFHRTLPASFQKAVRILGGDDPSAVDFEREMALTRRLLDSFPVKNLVGGLMRQNRGAPEAMIADVLLQPLERSYTVESLAELAGGCGLELVAPCPNRFDQAMNRHSWHVDLGDPELQEVYEALPDGRRWQVSNLLLFEQSPMIWFYLQRRDAGRPPKGERRICDELLGRRLAPMATVQRGFLRDRDGGYRPEPEAVPYPPPPADETVRRVVAAAAGGRVFGEVLAELGLPRTFAAVNRLRIQTTTSAAPYLRTLPADGAGGEAEARARDGARLGKLRRAVPKAINVEE